MQTIAKVQHTNRGEVTSRTLVKVMGNKMQSNQRANKNTEILETNSQISSDQILQNQTKEFLILWKQVKLIAIMHL